MYWFVIFKAWNLNFSLFQLYVYRSGIKDSLRRCSNLRKMYMVLSNYVYFHVPKLAPYLIYRKLQLTSRLNGKFRIPKLTSWILWRTQFPSSKLTNWVVWTRAATVSLGNKTKCLQEMVQWSPSRWIRTPLKRFNLRFLQRRSCPWLIWRSSHPWLLLGFFSAKETDWYHFLGFKSLKRELCAYLFYFFKSIILWI